MHGRFSKVSGYRRNLWLWLLVPVSVFIVVETSIVSATRQVATSSGCLLESYRYQPKTLYDVITGARWSYPSLSPYASVELNEPSHNDQYIAYLKPSRVGARSYWLLVEERATGKRLFGLPDAAFTTIQPGLPGFTLRWSPDDRWIAYQQAAPTPSGYLKVFGRDGSHMQQLDGLLGSYDWSADSRYLAVVEIPYELSRRDNWSLHFWSLADARLTTIALTQKLIVGLKWSPARHDVLAYLESGPGQTILNAPYSLVIASPEKGLLDRVPLSVGTTLDDIQWSPDGHYLIVQGKLFHFDGTHLVELTNAGVGRFVAWSVEGNSAIFLRSEADKTLSITAYHLIGRRQVTLLSGLADSPRKVDLTGRYLMTRRENRRLTVELGDLDGGRPVSLLKGAEQILDTRLPTKDNPIMVIKWAVQTEVERTFYITWARADGSGVRTIQHRFPETSDIYWVNDTAAAYVELLGQRLRAGLIDAVTGHVQLLIHSASKIDIKVVSSNHVLYQWRDSNKVRWVTGYDADGGLLYHLPLTPPVAEAFPAPDGTRILLRSQTLISDSLSIYHLGRPRIGQQRQLAAQSDEGWLLSPIWSSDSQRFALVAQTLAGQSSLDIFDREGQRIQQFVLTDSFDASYSILAWIPCDRAIDPTGRLR